MKEMGFSLNEIQQHMKNYTIDTSLIALRRQLTVLEQQIAHLRLVRNRLADRCAQMESVKAFQERNQQPAVKEVSPRYLLYAPVEKPYSFREISIATKKCFSQALKDELPIYFQTGVIVPYENILQERYTEASIAFLPIEKPKRPGTSAFCPGDGSPASTTTAPMNRWSSPTASCSGSAGSRASRLSRIPTNSASTTTSPPAMKPSSLPKSSSISKRPKPRTFVDRTARRKTSRKDDPSAIWEQPRTADTYCELDGSKNIVV